MGLFSAKLFKIIFILASIYLYLMFVLSLFPEINSSPEWALKPILQAIHNSYSAIVE